MAIEACAKYLKSSASTIYRFAQEGKIPAIKVENQWLFRKEKICNWLDRGSDEIEIDIDKKKNKK